MNAPWVPHAHFYPSSSRQLAYKNLVARQWKTNMYMYVMCACLCVLFLCSVYVYSYTMAYTHPRMQAICQQVMTRQPKLESAQSLAAEVLQIPSNQEERQKIEERLTSLFNDWDKICQQVSLYGRRGFCNKLKVCPCYSNSIASY